MAVLTAAQSSARHKGLGIRRYQPGPSHRLERLPSPRQRPFHKNPVWPRATGAGRLRGLSEPLLNHDGLVHLSDSNPACKDPSEIVRSEESRSQVTSAIPPAQRSVAGEG